MTLPHSSENTYDPPARERRDSMKRRIWNIPLLFGFLIPMVMLFWPFAYWGSTASLVLRILPAACIQLLFCRSAETKLMRLLPLLLTAAGALWGLYLFFTSPDWSCTFGQYLADYASPAISCGVAYLTDSFFRRK